MICLFIEQNFKHKITHLLSQEVETMSAD